MTFAPLIDSLRVGPWDLLLIAGVTLQATLVAYVRQPRRKGLVYTLPVPFSIANLALGEPVGPSHVVGLLNLLLYLNVVRWLHQRARAHIVLSIASAAVLYSVLGWAVNPLLPDTEPVFWVSWLVVLGVGVTLWAVLPHRDEPGHRSPLPVGLKLVIIAGVIGALVLGKGALGGFMPTFPMVGVVAAYEARHSLWTFSRSGPLIMLGLGSMAGAMRVAQVFFGFGVGASVGLGALVWLAVVIPITLCRWRRERRVTAQLTM